MADVFSSVWAGRNSLRRGKYLLHETEIFFDYGNITLYLFEFV